MSTPPRSRRRWGLVPAALAGALAAAWLPSIPIGHAAGGVGFAAPVFVDQVRAGGEPLILHSTKFGTLVYSAHEGTTHIDREGAASESTEQFLCPDLTSADCYKNHVWIWTSGDNGATWTLRDQNLAYTGFSDPDLTEDAGGSIYDTGIDLANEAVYSSQDGGITWPHGTTNCNEGDRPWLAGGKAGEVFMTTDAEISRKHTLFHSSTFADSCDGMGLDDTGIPDAGKTPDGGSFSGFGKGVYDRFDGSFIEPAQFRDKNGTIVGVGISRLADAAKAFTTTGAAFQPLRLADTPGVFSPFGAPQVISMDSAENIYFAWDTDDRDNNGKGGCGNVPNRTGGPTPLANRIMLEVGRHVGPGQWQFDKPIRVSHQGNARVLWPWSVAGSPGNVSVVWYQMDKMVDPDCDRYNSDTAVPDVKTYIYEAHITDALDPGRRHIEITNASGRAIHEGGICDSGTTCVATGQDRRLGDYFTNAIDGRGCVIIASGDTTVPDPLTGQPRVTSLPIFMRQNSGPSLTGNDCASTAAASSSTPAPTSSVAAATATPTPAAAPSTLPNTAAAGAGTAGAAAAGAAAIGALLLLGRRRRRRG